LAANAAHGSEVGGQKSEATGQKSNITGPRPEANRNFRNQKSEISLPADQRSASR
jgi:hypothetical protein